MANQSYHKSRPLLLHQYLLANSDPRHPVTTAQCIDHLASHQIYAQRKSIYGDMDALQSAGVDIQFRKGKQSGWYIEERTFSLPDLKLMVDAIQAFSSLNQRKKEALILKLTQQTSVHQAPQLCRPIHLTHQATTGGNLCLTLDKLHRAIALNKTVLFRYANPSPSIEGKRYSLTPYGLIYENQQYFLIGYNHTLSFVCHYALHHMEDVVVTSLPGASSSQREAFSMDEYIHQIFPSQAPKSSQ